MHTDQALARYLSPVGPVSSSKGFQSKGIEGGAAAWLAAGQKLEGLGK